MSQENWLYNWDPFKDYYILSSFFTNCFHPAKMLTVPASAACAQPVACATPRSLPRLSDLQSLSAKKYVRSEEEQGQMR